MAKSLISLLNRVFFNNFNMCTILSKISSQKSEWLAFSRRAMDIETSVRDFDFCMFTSCCFIVKNKYYTTDCPAKNGPFCRANYAATVYATKIGNTPMES